MRCWLTAVGDWLRCAALVAVLAAVIGGAVEILSALLGAE